LYHLQYLRQCLMLGWWGVHCWLAAVPQACLSTTVRIGLLEGLLRCLIAGFAANPGLRLDYLGLFVVLVYLDGSNQLGCCSLLLFFCKIFAFACTVHLSQRISYAKPHGLAVLRDSTAGGFCIELPPCRCMLRPTVLGSCMQCHWRAEDNVSRLLHYNHWVVVNLRSGLLAPAGLRYGNVWLL
jgi:hypothetical protein